MMSDINLDSIRGLNGDLVFQFNLGHGNIIDVLKMLCEGKKITDKMPEAQASSTTNQTTTQPDGDTAVTDNKAKTGKGHLEEVNPAHSSTGDYSIEQQAQDCEAPSHEAGQQAQDCEAPSRKAEKQALRNTLASIRDDIRNAKSEYHVRNALDSLNGFLDDIEQDADLGTYVPNLRGVLNGVNMHDKTRDELYGMISTLLEAIDGMIAEEEKREKAEMLKRLFLEMADKAEALVDVLDLNAVFG